MFTGIIEESGRVQRIQPGKAATGFTLSAPRLARGLRVGGSLAVNGACLTVAEKKGTRLRFDVLEETLRCTNLGSLSPGDRVNLERPLAVNGRLDGHFVLGHVDGTARVRRIGQQGADHVLELALPRKLRPYVIPKGSIAVDGISLTIAALGNDWLRIWVIPHTWKVTNLCQKQKGERVNLEVDLLAKHVVRFMELQPRR